MNMQIQLNAQNQEFHNDRLFKLCVENPSGKVHGGTTSKSAKFSALSLCPSLVQHRAIPSRTSRLMVKLLSAIHSRQLLYASKAFYMHHSMRRERCGRR